MIAGFIFIVMGGFLLGLGFWLPRLHRKVAELLGVLPMGAQGMVSAMVPGADKGLKVFGLLPMIAKICLVIGLGVGALGIYAFSTSTVPLFLNILAGLCGTLLVAVFIVLAVLYFKYRGSLGAMRQITKM